MLEPQSEESGDEWQIEISSDTIARWFHYLSLENVGIGDRKGELRNARYYWELLRTRPTRVWEDSALGQCRLWVQVGEGLPRNVALMRKSGMLVTTRQRGLISFRGLRDFVAICRFEGVKGNELLRRMENPQHNQFEPDRLPTAQQELGKRALKRVADKIREILREEAGPLPLAAPEQLTELARYLPDLEPDEPFGSGEDADDERDPQFGGSPKVRLRPRPRPSVPVPGPDDDDPDDWHEPTPSPDPSPPNPNPDPLPPNPSPSRRRGRIPISDTRIIPITGRTNRYRVGLTAGEGGLATLELFEAGDSAVLRRNDIRAYSLGGHKLSLSKMKLETRRRIEFEITADKPIGDRAWLISAFRGEPA